MTTYLCQDHRYYTSMALINAGFFGATGVGIVMHMDSEYIVACVDDLIGYWYPWWLRRDFLFYRVIKYNVIKALVSTSLPNVHFLYVRIDILIARMGAFQFLSMNNATMFQELSIFLQFYKCFVNYEYGAHLCGSHYQCNAQFCGYPHTYKFL